MNRRWSLIALIPIMAGIVTISTPLREVFWHNSASNQPPSIVQQNSGSGFNYNGNGGRININNSYVQPRYTPRPMSVISGLYSVCIDRRPVNLTSDGYSERWLDFFAKIAANEGRIAYFSVQIGTGCASPNTALFTFPRSAGSTSVSYRLDPGIVFEARKALGSSAPCAGLITPSLKTGHDPCSFMPDNGINIVFVEPHHENPLSTLTIFNEGVDDTICGPFQIASSSDDAEVTYTLSAPILDSVSEDEAADLKDQHNCSEGA